MLFMNRYEVEDAQHRYASHPVLGPATTTLASLVEWTDSHSDGWAYWVKPVNAAKGLQELIMGDRPASRYYDQRREDATPERYKAALRSVKAFRTRQGADFEIVEVSS